jgi:hypothetical protein
MLQLAFSATRQNWWKRHAHLARNAGLKRLFLILSFDCDTDQDAQQVMKLHKQLLAIGIRPTYAVPGEILQEHKEIFLNIFQMGERTSDYKIIHRSSYDTELMCHAKIKK